MPTRFASRCLMLSRPDRAVTALVAAAWVAMTASACVYVARYGYNLPRLDEWEFVPVVCGHEDAARWVCARHNEHRFPLARAIYLGLHAATGQNFRAGMWLSVALLSASAAGLCLAARRLRGRSALLDVLIPLLLLNAGHAENLTMGYQIAFTLTVGFLALFLVAVAWADRLGPRNVAAVCGVATLGVALGGGVGCAFAPGLGLFTLGRVTAACRLSARPHRTALTLSLLPVLASLYVVASIVELKLGGGTRPGNDFATARGVAFDFWTVALGGAGQSGYPLPGLVVVGCVAEALLAAAFVGVARPVERERVAGCAAVIVGAVTLSLVIGVTRPLGNESRYAVFGAIALCAAIVARARPSEGKPTDAPGVLLVPALAVAAAWLDWQCGREFAEVYAVRTAMLRRDLDRGLPVNVLAERHVIFPVAGYAEHFETLYESGHVSLRDAGPPRRLRVTSIALPPDAELPAYDGTGPAPAFEVRLPTSLAMDALRLEFESPYARYRAVYRLELPTSTDDTAGLTTMWVVPGRRTMVFRVEGTLDRVVVRPVEKAAAMKLLRCEAITYE